MKKRHARGEMPVLGADPDACGTGYDFQRCIRAAGAKNIRAATGRRSRLCCKSARGFPTSGPINAAVVAIAES